MSKWFEVKVTKTTVYAVEVEDHEGAEQAERYALFAAMDFNEAQVSSEVTGDENIDRMHRHADEVLNLGAAND